MRLTVLYRGSVALHDASPPIEALRVHNWTSHALVHTPTAEKILARTQTLRRIKSRARSNGRHPALYLSPQQCNFPRIIACQHVSLKSTNPSFPALFTSFGFVRREYEAVAVVEGIPAAASEYHTPNGKLVDGYNGESQGRRDSVDSRFRQEKQRMFLDSVSGQVDQSTDFVC